MSDINQDARAEHEAKVAAQDNEAPSTWEAFEAELKGKTGEIAKMLPPSIPKDRFINAVITAVKKTPRLLACHRRSLFIQIEKAATDGLLPDGREGVLLPQHDKVQNSAGKYVDILGVLWNPMTWGIRKRAREIDGIVIDTQVVHANDKFSRKQGDHPCIEHEPPPLGSERGAMVGCYAIFKLNDQTILHREVMDADQVAKVKAKSKQPNGSLWKDFPEEAWRKSVLRRGTKSVPCSEALQTVIERWDDNFDFSAQPAVVTAPPTTLLPPVQPRATAPALPPPGSEQPVAMPPVSPKRAEEPASLPPVQSKPPIQTTAVEAPVQSQGHSERTLLKKFDTELTTARTPDEVDNVWQMYERDFAERGRDFVNATQAAYEKHMLRVKPQGKAA
jgi:phage RecT family recombinase